VFVEDWWRRHAADTGVIIGRLQGRVEEDEEPLRAATEYFHTS